MTKVNRPVLTRYARWGLWLALTGWIFWLMLDRWIGGEDMLLRLDGPLWALVAAVLLMPVNWGLEAWKYRTLLGDCCLLPSGRLWRGVLGGITLSMTLPNRLGESLGRLAFLSPAERGAGLSASVTGSALQMAWILSGGLAAMVWVGGDVLHFYPDLFHGMTWLIPLFALVMGLLLVWAIPAARRILRSSWMHFKKNLGFARVTEAAVAGLLRYGTFILQYLLLLYFAGATGTLPEWLCFAALVFFCQSILPLPPAVGWVGRLQLAVLVSGWTGILAGQAMMASVLLWMINLFIPGLLGAVFLLRSNREIAQRDVKILLPRT